MAKEAWQNLKQLLSGNEAIALGAYHAGVAVAAAYPGTPSTEILENLARFDDIYVEWSTNEKVALEVAMGAAYGGVRALASMKHVGLNVAADPFFAASTTGVIGGLVVVSCDDPGEHSSQGEQDNRHFARFAKVPMLEPTDSQEAYDLMEWAFKISEEFDTPVLLRSTTRISHCKTVVNVDRERRTNSKQPGFTRSPSKFVMVPSNARPRRNAMEERIVKLRSYVETFPMNQIIVGDRKLGIVSSGVAYQYAREVFKNASFLKLVTTYPFPEELICKFAREVETVLVIEELDPYLEDELRRLRISVIGKEFIPIIGELTPEIVEQGAMRAGLLPARSKASAQPKASPVPLPARRPQLCAGCPHVGAEYVIRKLCFQGSGSGGPLKKEDVIVTSDIGCYTLGVYPPLAALDTCACMGASITQAIGLAKAKVPNKVVAVLGDSTFMHSGITGLVDAVYNQANITVIILDNGTTAMTGHQGHPATGISARGEKARKVELEKVVEGVGVKDLHVVSAFDLKAIESALKHCLEADETSVIIVRGPCPLNVRAKGTASRVDEDLCTGCYTCLDIGCPALTIADDKAQIDASICVGSACGICAQVCPQEAIVKGT
jgi:indolepyruvate ferredoxin oxidoreductase alpha subunit